MNDTPKNLRSKIVLMCYVHSHLSTSSVATFYYNPSLSPPSACSPALHPSRASASFLRALPGSALSLAALACAGSYTAVYSRVHGGCLQLRFEGHHAHVLGEELLVLLVLLVVRLPLALQLAGLSFFLCCFTHCLVRALKLFLPRGLPLLVYKLDFVTRCCCDFSRT